MFSDSACRQGLRADVARQEEREKQSGRDLRRSWPQPGDGRFNDVYTFWGFKRLIVTYLGSKTNIEKNIGFVYVKWGSNRA